MLILPKIVLDLDGVVVGFFQKLVAMYNKRYSNDPLTLDDINCELEQLGPERAERLIGMFNEPGWFLDLEPLPGAINTISHYINGGYQIVICTAPARYTDGRINGTSAAEKFVWIQEHLPMLGNRITIAQHKEDVNGDLFLDDTPYQVINWCESNPGGIGVLIDQPWNKRWVNLPGNATRANLEDIGRIVADFWCSETGRFAYKVCDLRNWSSEDPI